jgi:hypothetical protein
MKTSAILFSLSMAIALFSCNQNKEAQTQTTVAEPVAATGGQGKCAG